MTFNQLLVSVGLQLDQVWLVRHRDSKAPKGHPTPYDLWRADDGRFELYQAIQTDEIFKGREYLASFVVGKETEPAIFVGIWRIAGLSRAPSGTIDPVRLNDVGGSYLYETEPDTRLSQHRGVLRVVWGPSYIRWWQMADRNDKDIFHPGESELEDWYRTDPAAGKRRLERQGM